ncbi:hypothetical protein CFC21_040629 [Triticum aestivum]|uniref:Uncharacterized protein n=3 Tax=Triticum TaxID=4564 RepID=A0A3B6FNA5_WHEAT|nr:hypothetical protein CFC21_040629 [Triticum aestivum]
MWVLEMPVVGWVLLYILKKDNLINKLVSEAEIPEPPLFTSTHRWEDTPEQNVSLTKPGLSTAERVREAIDCLPARQIRFSTVLGAVVFQYCFGVVVARFRVHLRQIIWLKRDGMLRCTKDSLLMDSLWQ